MLLGHLSAESRHSEAGERISEAALLVASAENSADARRGEAFAAPASLPEDGATAPQHFDDTIGRLAAEE